jgi:opacity protein-like surface antigen
MRSDTSSVKRKQLDVPRPSAWLLASALVAQVLVAPAARAERSELDPALGYNYGEIETARIAATGGAQRALSSSLGALFVNPANIAVERVYHIGAFAQIWPEAKRQSYGAGAVDSIGSSSRVAGAAGVTYNFQDPDGIDRKWTDARFALAYPFSEQFYFGVGGRYLLLSQDGLGPLGKSYASGGIPDQQIIRTFSFDAGATFKATPELAFALTGSNLANPGHGFLPTSVGGGIGYGAKQFAIQGDLVGDFTSWDDSKARAMLGLEVLLADHYALRGGYRYDQGAQSHGLGLGVGYIDRAFIFDIGLRRIVSGEEATTVVLGFTYHLETTGLTPSAGDTF